MSLILILLFYVAIWVITGVLAMIRLSAMHDPDDEKVFQMLVYSTVIGFMWPIFWLLLGYAKASESMT